MPYPTESACRINQPTGKKTRRVNGEREHEGKKYDVIYQIGTDGQWQEQAYRYPKETWTTEAARTHCKSHKGISFEAPGSEAENSCGLDNTTSAVTNPNVDFNPDNGLLSLNILGEIGVDTRAQDILPALNSSVKNILLNIHSPGGSITDGFAIFDALNQIPCPVHVKITGLAASIASVIAMAGDTIEMTTNSFLMLHKPFIPETSGTAEKLASEAGILSKMETAIQTAYENRCNDPTKVKDMMSAVTWLTAEEAKKLGFVDLISNDNSPVIVNISKNLGYVMPDFVKAKCQIVIPEMPKEQESFIARIIDAFKNTFNNKEKSMDPMKKIEELELQKKKLEEEMSALKAEYENQKKVLCEMQAKIDAEVQAKAKAAEETQLAEFKNYVDGLVGKGKIKPTMVQTHVNSMVLAVKAGAEHLNSYKAMLEDLPEVVKVGDTHVATTTEAATHGTEDYSAKAKEIFEAAKTSGNPISFGKALAQAMKK